MVITSDKTAVEIEQRLSCLEAKLDQLTEKITDMMINCPNCFEPQQFQEFHGALFRIKERGVYDDAVFCEKCRVQLFAHGSDLMSCPSCKTGYSFNKHDMHRMVLALNSGKVE